MKDDDLRASEAPAGERTADKHSGGVTVAEVQELLADADVVSNDAGRPFITFTKDRIRQTHPLSSDAFRYWVIAEAYNKLDGRMPNNQTIEQVRALSAANAQFRPDKRNVVVRVGHRDNRIYVDLGDPQWTAVEIDAHGFRLVPHPSGMFVRPHGLLPLPEPTIGGAIEDLAPLLNLNEHDFDLVVVFLVGSLSQSGSYPLLAVTGEAGSGKTTTSRTIARIIDPFAVQAQGNPKEPRDLVIAVSNRYLVALDNLSSMPSALADVLCRISSGTGMTYRQNYSDRDEVLFTPRNPVIFNGIPDLSGVRADVLDRCLIVTCPPIDDAARRSEKDIEAEFQRLLPGILGGLCSAASHALASLEAIRRRPQSLPRLADVAQFVEAAAPSLGWEPGHTVNLMLTQRGTNRSRHLAADPLTPAILDLVAQKGADGWSGTATALLGELRAQTRADVKHKQWPKNAATLSTRLSHLGPALRDAGVIIERRRDGHGGSRLLALRSLHVDAPHEGEVSNDNLRIAQPPDSVAADGHDDAGNLWKQIVSRFPEVDDDADDADDRRGQLLETHQGG